MVEKSPAQTRALAKPVLAEQLLAGATGGKIEGIFVTHLAGNPELEHQRFQPGDGMQACEIRARCPFEAVGFRQLGERPIDFP